MPNLKEVKSRIQSVNSTQQITKAMKMVAAAKLRRAQDRIEAMRPYSEKLNFMLQHLSALLDDERESEFTEQREVKRVLVILITSDRGLCGAFNSNVFRRYRSMLDTDLAALEGTQEGITLMPIGRKAADFVAKQKRPSIMDYAELMGGLEYEQVRRAAAFSVEAYKQKRFDKVIFVYNEFKNVATQILRSETFLPLTPQVADEEDAKPETLPDFIFEPNKEEILKMLLPASLNATFYKALLESNAAEHGARMTAMDQATENAKELLKELRLTYNRTRQAAITKEILEIVGGADALDA